LDPDPRSPITKNVILSKRTEFAARDLARSRNSGGEPKDLHFLPSTAGIQPRMNAAIGPRRDREGVSVAWTPIPVP
jgi:hypothetical protein